MDHPVTFLNVSLDVVEADWREAVAEHEIEGVHVRADGWGEDVAKSYQVNSLPSYYLVDSQGLIVERLRILRRYRRDCGDDREELVSKLSRCPLVHDSRGPQLGGLEGPRFRRLHKTCICAVRYDALTHCLIS